jgi:hypothetical protein
MQSVKGILSAVCIMMNVGRVSILSAEGGGFCVEIAGDPQVFSELFSLYLVDPGKSSPFVMILHTNRAHTPKGHSQKVCSGLREDFFSFMGF